MRQIIPRWHTCARERLGQTATRLAWGTHDRLPEVFDLRQQALGAPWLPPWSRAALSGFCTASRRAHCPARFFTVFSE